MFVAEPFDVYTDPNYLHNAPIRAGIRDLRRRSTSAQTATPAPSAPRTTRATAGSEPDASRPRALKRLAPPESAFQPHTRPRPDTPDDTKPKRRKHKAAARSNPAMDATAAHKRRRTDDNGNGNGHTTGHGHNHSHHSQGGSVQPTSPPPQPSAPPSSSPTPTARSSAPSPIPLETAVASLPKPQLRALLLRHAATHPPLATDLHRAHASLARHALRFDHHADAVRRELHGSSSKAASGAEAFARVRAALAAVGRAARPPASFATRRNALVALRRIGATVCRSGEGGVGARVVRLFQEAGEDTLVGAFEDIVDGLREEEKAEVRGWGEGEGGEGTFEDELFELVEMAEEMGVFDGLSVAAEKLGLVFEYGDSDENGVGEGGRPGSVDAEGGRTFAAVLQGVWRSLDIDDASGSAQCHGAFDACFALENAIETLHDGGLREDCFASRRNALVALREVADIILQPADDALTHQIRRQFQSDSSMASAFSDILDSLTNDEKHKLLVSKDGDSTFGRKFFDTAGMAKENGIMVGLKDILRELEDQFGSQSQ
ncbi:hypothetical protein SLS56_005460 [Neofusicoccum ribis]|uniref:Wings apart-like protein C-terminal domain-containing protein n=1 Tax=Neofusicoccum ribis TaxID=45134 RepID=A0ABR3SUE4_9PEZI